jgi:hypothetical protein
MADWLKVVRNRRKRIQFGKQRKTVLNPFKGHIKDNDFKKETNSINIMYKMVSNIYFFSHEVRL